ncbi:hypothetical protein AAE478_007219 [Parahypoxylon ruwenzoriense]
MNASTEQASIYGEGPTYGGHNDTFTFPAQYIRSRKGPCQIVYYDPATVPTHDTQASTTAGEKFPADDKRQQSSKNEAYHAEEKVNCAVWVGNLPVNINFPTLLQKLRGTGKIFATMIHGPQRRHQGSAAKIVFWDRAGLERFLAKVQTGEFSFNGAVPQVRPHGTHIGAQEPSHRSRVMEIFGPSEIVNFETLNSHFRGACFYDIESIETLWKWNGLTMMRWSFGSFRNQAGTVARFLHEHKKNMNFTPEEKDAWEQVRFRYASDPCDPWGI